MHPLRRSRHLCSGTPDPQGVPRSRTRAGRDGGRPCSITYLFRRQSVPESKALIFRRLPVSPSEFDRIAMICSNTARRSRGPSPRAMIRISFSPRLKVPQFAWALSGFAVSGAPTTAQHCLFPDRCTDIVSVKYTSSRRLYQYLPGELDRVGLLQIVMSIVQHGNVAILTRRAKRDLAL